MGRVWVAHHHRLRTQVAVKFVSDKLADDREEALARFEHEATVASQIKSPHVVQTFDSGVTPEGVPFIVMELLHGESFGQRLRRQGHVSLHEVTTVLQHTALGLSEAHAIGIVHRDIKPDNIFLCQTATGFFCKLLDFGIAKQTRLPAMGGLTTDGKLVGTPEYMSPEQVLEDRAVDFRADLWALAVVTYQALTGHLPFQGATLGQLCLNLVGKSPQRPTLFRPDLPPRVDAWFSRALNRDAKMRFTSALQMAESFAALDDDLAFHTAEVTENTERHLSSSHTLQRKHKQSAVLTAAGVAAAVAILGGGSWLATQSNREPTILAQHALGPMVSRVADRATEASASGTSETEVIDLDDQQRPTPSPNPGGPLPPRTTPVARGKGPTAAPPEPAPLSVPSPSPNPSPNPSPSPSPAPNDAGRNRTKANTGF